MTPEGLIAVRKLNSLSIQTNVTLIFSQNQALLAAKAGATYASIFVGRLDDIGEDGIQIVKNTRMMFDIYHFPTQIISASIRHPKHVSDAALAGSHAITIPPQILEKLFLHPLTDQGLAQFLDDWKKRSISNPHDSGKK
jgi:transaldolase